MRVTDDPATQFEEPEVDSPLTQRHTAASLRLLGVVLLLLAAGALPLIRPDITAGHYFYASTVALIVVIGLVLIAIGYGLHRRPAS